MSRSTVLLDHGKLRRRCGGFCPPRSVTAIDSCPPSAWNGSWDDSPNNPSAASAVRAMTCAIRAASALGERGRTSCKRQVSGSNPLTGSQLRRVKHPTKPPAIVRWFHARDRKPLLRTYRLKRPDRRSARCVLEPPGFTSGFKSVRNSRPTAAPAWTLSVSACHVIQHHPVHIP